MNCNCFADVPLGTIAALIFVTIIVISLSFSIFIISKSGKKLKRPAYSIGEKLKNL